MTKFNVQQTETSSTSKKQNGTPKKKTTSINKLSMKEINNKIFKDKCEKSTKLKNKKLTTIGEKDIVEIANVNKVYDNNGKHTGGMMMDNAENNSQLVEIYVPDENKMVYGISFKKNNTVRHFYLKCFAYDDSELTNVFRDLNILYSNANTTDDISVKQYKIGVYEWLFYEHFNNLNVRFGSTVNVIDIYGSGFINNEDSALKFVIGGNAYEFDSTLIGSNLELQPDKTYTYMVLEWNKDLVTLETYLNMNNSYVEQSAMIAECYNSLNRAYNKFDFIHCDLHKANILVDAAMRKAYFYDFDKSEIGGKILDGVNVRKFASSVHLNYRVDYIFRILNKPWYSTARDYSKGQVLKIHNEKLWKEVFHALDQYNLVVENSMHSYRNWSFNRVKKFITIEEESETDQNILELIKNKYPVINVSRNSRVNAYYDTVYEGIKNAYRTDDFFKMQLFAIIYSIATYGENSPFYYIKNTSSIRNSNSNNSDINANATFYNTNAELGALNNTYTHSIQDAIANTDFKNSITMAQDNAFYERRFKQLMNTINIDKKENAQLKVNVGSLSRRSSLNDLLSLNTGRNSKSEEMQTIR